MPFVPADDLWVNVRPNRTFILLRTIVYKGQTDAWVIPRGFETDFASVPRILTPVFPAIGTYNRAALLHDYLCRVARHEFPGVVVSRADADRIFRRVMREEGTRPIVYWPMFAAVRLFGIIHP